MFKTSCKLLNFVDRNAEALVKCTYMLEWSYINDGYDNKFINKNEANVRENIKIIDEIN